MDYNGSAIIAMTGKNCIGIAADRRLGQNLTTIDTNFTKIFNLQPRIMVGFSGLATDVQTVRNQLEYHLKLYELREERNMSPSTLSHRLSTMLYEKRFGPYYMEPVIAALDDEGKPFLSSMDLIGATMSAKDFVVAGNCTGNLFGMAESLWKPDLEPDQLFEVLAQSLLSAVDRDALTGWGGVVHIVTMDGITTRELKGRQD